MVNDNNNNNNKQALDQRLADDFLLLSIDFATFIMFQAQGLQVFASV